MVMRGYDTHVPDDGLLRAARDEAALRQVPNLLWKDRDQRVVDNGYVHKPDTMACGIDWRTAPRAPAAKGSFAIREYLSVQNAGCAYNCGWCGGSREAFRRINHRKNTMIRKPIDQVSYEFESLRSTPATENYHFYSVGAYNETREGLDNLIQGVHDAGLKSVSNEQFHLTPRATLKQLAQANKNTLITLSPESHDLRVRQLADRLLVLLRHARAGRRVREGHGRLLRAPLAQVQEHAGQPDDLPDDPVPRSRIDVLREARARLQGVLPHGRGAPPRHDERGAAQPDELRDPVAVAPRPRAHRVLRGPRADADQGADRHVAPPGRRASTLAGRRCACVPADRPRGRLAGRSGRPAACARSARQRDPPPQPADHHAAGQQPGDPVF